MPAQNTTSTNRRAGLSGLKPAALILLGLAPRPGTKAWHPLSTEGLKESIPGYEVIGFVGRGGMGAVYHGRQHQLERQVAIKLLPQEISADADFAERFRREARILAALHHPNIVAIYDSGETLEGHLYSVMEYVHGNDLQARMNQGGFDLATFINVLEQICQGLEHAHLNGVIHRDLKPSNVLLDQFGQVKVADFGLATGGLKFQEKLTQTGTVLGTLDYSAPEQIAGNAKPDIRSDIYSLGVLAYEMLTGVLPRGLFEPPSKTQPALWRFDDVILQALRHDPQDRFSTVADFRIALLRAYESSTEAAREDLLLSAADAPVLEEMYLSAVAMTPAGLRVCIEEELLTQSGFRESRLAKDLLDRSGASEEDLRGLIRLHILRMIDRGTLQRVEIAHDRLVGPIQASRDRRRAEAAAHAASRREQEIQSKLRRRNLLAAIMAVLTLSAILSAAMAWRNDQEAQRNEVQARANRKEAEGLVAFLLGRMQYISQSLGRVDMAEHLMANVERYYVTAASAAGDVDFLRNKADFFRLKGNVRLDLGDSSASARAYRKAAELRRQIILITETDVRCKLDLAEDLSHLEDALRAEGDTNGVDAAIVEKGKVSRQALAQDPGNHAAWDYLLRCRLADARRFHALGNTAEALDQLRHLAREADDRSARQPGSWPEKFSVYRAHRALASTLDEAGNLEESLISARICEGVARDKTGHEPANFLYEVMLARSHFAAGTVLRKLGREGEALPLLQHAADVLEKMVEISPRIPAQKSELATVYAELARTLDSLGKPVEKEAIILKRGRL